MKWILALHIIFMVTWFAGLFYLPRLYVYHAMSKDKTSTDRFKIMERKLYFGITTPSALLSTFFGLWLLFQHYDAYSHMMWMHLKLFLVMLLWGYQLYLGFLWWIFKTDRNQHSHTYYRYINEFPVLLLFAIVILVIVKPF